MPTPTGMPDDPPPAFTSITRICIVRRPLDAYGAPVAGRAPLLATRTLLRRTRLPLALLVVHPLFETTTRLDPTLSSSIPSSTPRSADRSNPINHLHQSPCRLETLLRSGLTVALSFPTPAPVPPPYSGRRCRIRHEPRASPTVSRGSATRGEPEVAAASGPDLPSPDRNVTGSSVRGHDAARSAPADPVQERHRPPPLPRPGASGGRDGSSTGRRQTQAARRPRA